MPDERRCPVIRAYFHQATKAGYCAVTQQSAVADFLFVELDELDVAGNNPLGRDGGVVTRRLRAFHCLHGLFMLVRNSRYPDIKLHQVAMPLTRENVQGIIETCRTVSDSAESAIYSMQLGQRPVAGDLVERDKERIMKLCGITIKAARYLRARLHLDVSYSGMGKLYAEGLCVTHAPVAELRRHGMALINVTHENRGAL